MFAVPGWNVSAPIATQVAQPKPKDPNKLGKKALKRKAKQELQVNAENIGEYWDKVVEGGDVKSTDQAEKSQQDEEAGDNDAPEKRGKKRKRGKRSKAAKEDDDAEKDTEAVVTAQPAETSETNSKQKSSTADAESQRDKKKRKKDHKSDKDGNASAMALNEISKATVPVSLIPEPVGLTPLQKSMRSKLASARFRHLNESLYTKPSAESLDLFKDDPSMFEDYHRGFAQQVEVWPENPVDSYVNSILARGKVRNRDPWKDKKRKEKGKKGSEKEEVVLASDAGVRATGDAKPLPRNFKGHATIADLGCGTASLSYRLQPHLKQLNLTLHSFDLSKPSGPSAPLVTVADISSLPVPDGSVDVAIFCLALMGTNWLDFIDEAYRVLRWRGELWISEIKSRFGRVGKKKGAPINSIGSLKKPMDKKPKGKKSKGDKAADEEEGIAGSDDEAELAERVDGAEGKEGTDVSAFVEVLKKRGFVLDALPEKSSEAIDLSNKMFVKMQFVKAAPATKGKNAKKEADGKSGAGDRGLKFGMKGKKFAAVVEDDGVDDELEKKVLKPCLYKIR